RHHRAALPWRFRSHEKLDAAQRSIAIDEVDALQPDLESVADLGEMVRCPGGVERLLVGSAFDIMQRSPGHVAPLLVVALVDPRRLQHVVATTFRALAISGLALQPVDTDL